MAAIKTHGFSIVKFSQLSKPSSKGNLCTLLHSSNQLLECRRNLQYRNYLELGYLSKDTEEEISIFRCQGFWHLALNLSHLPQKCVRCAGNHAAKDCNPDLELRNSGAQTATVTMRRTVANDRFPK
ncbi:hypothetical protein CEXT_811381 [Caerostris extrusa]|uniref:Uncharacterized protein n=1 Tax=Caerostris extrusa TaxID=172846 RepID=A0AAV4SIY6_CAEEX|nr:hypothetical protein CEXT_811381 [Caerostris extrusa]